MQRMNPEVDAYLENAGAWREETALLRSIILGCGLTEELKWGKPCYTFGGSNILVIQGFKDHCSLMFCKGALLKDPAGILKKPGENTQAARRIEFTAAKEITKLKSTVKAYIHEAIAAEKAGLEVDFKKEPEPIPEELRRKWKETPGLKAAFEALTPGRRRAYILHFSAAKQSKTREARIDKHIQDILAGKGLNDRPTGTAAKKTKPPKISGKDEIVLLSGGNPQIPKGDGDAPVQAYIAAMPGWKSDLGKRLDALIVRAVPDVRKAVKWNSPFYGIEGRGFFVSFHVLTRSVKITFFAGTSLDPVPPGGTERSKEARWIDIHENEGLDEKQMAGWIRQAAALPGWTP